MPGGRRGRTGCGCPGRTPGKVASLRELAGWLPAEIGLLDAVIAGLPGDWRPCHAVRAPPGPGPVLAAVAVAGIGDISRLVSPGHLCSRAGLTPRHRESGLKAARGHLARQGPPNLRRAMAEAIRHQPDDSPPRELRDRIIARRGARARDIARAAAARKLLTCVFYALRDGQVRSLAARSHAQQAG